MHLGLPTPSMTGTIGVGLTPASVTFNHAGNRAYVGNQDGGSVSILDVTAGTVVATRSFGSAVFAVAVAPGDTVLFVGTASTVYRVRLADLAITDSVALPSYSNALAMRDTLLYASVPFGGLIQEIDIRTAAVTRTLFVGGTPQGLAFPATGDLLYIANEAGQLQLWSLTTNTLSGSVPLAGGGGFGVGVNPANGLVYVSTSYFGSRVHVIDPVARSVVRVIHTSGVPRRIGFAPTGNVGIVTNEGGWVDYIR
jgi:DNA-binding beta-propeller fold protein YncE